jgi:ABC-type multidrug transport system fused ATPase/permease subunit
MKQLKTLKMLFKITSKLSKKYYFVIYLQAIVKTLKAFIGVYGIKLIIDGVVEGNYINALKYALIVLVSESIIFLLERKAANLVEITQQVMIQSLMQASTLKMMKIDYANLENPIYLDMKVRAKYAIEQLDAVSTFFRAIADSLYLLFVLISMLSILVIFNPFVLIIMFASVLFHALTTKAASKHQIKLFNDLGPINRKYSYYLTVIIGSRFAKDFRMYPLAELMNNKYNHFKKDMIQYLKSINRKIGFYSAIYSVINYSQILLVYLFIGYQAIKKVLGVSSFIYLTASALKASEAFSGLIDKVQEFRKSAQFLEPFVELMNLSESNLQTKKGLITKPLHELSFDHVSFSYPGTNKIVLDDISFTIKKGEKISIVGINGAGKTTLIKLISRLYEPTSGRIIYNGIDIRNYNYDSYIRMIAAVFQDFKLFALTLHENVDLDKTDAKAVYDCCSLVGLKDKLDELPEGINSYYSKEYHQNGIELSGGEMQKISIARAMYKNASLLILDEPTSALDPLAEAEIYQNFANLIQDKTAIFISHRMSSSVFCDRIIVIDSGKVQAINTHQNLMKNTEGTYYRLFNSQSQYYKLDNEETH